jgi:phage terminase large subunit GpA-like protein
VEILLDPIALRREIARLGGGAYLTDPVDLLQDALSRYRPPDRISTVDWAERNRKFRLPDSGAMVPYDRMRTPYNIAPSDALDEPGVELVVMVKPSRSGGTTIAENYLGKMIDIGPMGRVGWYLGSDDSVKEYVEGAIKPLFEDHPRLAAKVGKGRSDNTDFRKRVAGHLIEFLAAKDGNFRNREFVFGVMDEPDGWTKFSESPKTQLQGRQKNLGRRRKGFIISHPDKGWRAGVAAAWEQTSRGIYVMRCPDCEYFAAAHSTKFWPDVPQFKLHYARNDKLGVDARIAMAGNTAGMACPHCGVVHDDKTRFAMVDEAGLNGWWMHRGQTLDPVDGIQGEPDQHRERGFYVHGLMVKTSPAAELAKGLEEALIKFERSGGSKTAAKALREFMSKQLGEIFEGKKDIEGVSAAGLMKRARTERALQVGEFPAEALFITAAVDVGLKKFDVSFRAWDEEGRSWWLDRLTLRQRPGPDGRLRDINTRERAEDWDILIEEVIQRRFPIVGTDLAMPVAQVVVDVSDGNVTWIGREFAARCYTKGLYWGGARGPKWPRVQLVQGSPTRTAAELPPKPRLKDDEGRKFPLGAWEWSLGVHKLKELALERLATQDGGPGQCYFAEGLSSEYFDEYFNEPLIEGKFERQGPNESLDLFGYEEAARLMLKPDRADIDWATPARRPLWARPVSLQSEGGDPAAVGTGAKKQDVLARLSALNKGPVKR